jgi:hypothetical protein
VNGHLVLSSMVVSWGGPCSDWRQSKHRIPSGKVDFNDRSDKIT